MKFNFTLALIICAGLFGLASCKKQSQFVLSYKVSGNKVILSWSGANESSLLGYTIYRSSDTSRPNPDHIVHVDKNTTTFVDTMLLSPAVQYYVTASTNQSLQTTNKVSVTRSDIQFAAITPFDALYDRNSQMLYVYSLTGDIAVYDINAKKWTRQMSFGAGIGYCDIGIYNGKTELYVPRADGWLFIYDATTLTQIDQINIGTALYSVAYNNGVLFISAAFGQSSNFATVTYRRSTKSEICRCMPYDQTRFKLVQGTNSEFYCITAHNDLCYVKFDSSGSYVSQTVNNHPNDAVIPTPDIFEIFPDGSNMITTGGFIYGRDLTYLSNLPRGNSLFTTFCFDNTKQLIYAGCSQQQIQAYSMSDYQIASTFATQGYPFKVFYANGSLISVSTNTPSYPYNDHMYTAIEHF